MIEAQPKTTRAAVWYGNNDVRLEERPLPALGPRDVLVQVKGSGLCATDVHLVEGLIPFYQPPRVLGHETSGLVRGVGSEVRSVRMGQAVAIDPTVGCDACFSCYEGRTYHCPNRVSHGNGLADYQVVPDRIAHPLPAGFSVELGAFAEPLSCAIHAVEQSGLRVGESVAIVGAGTIGLLTMQVALRSGATTMIVSDPEPARRALALELGATVAVDPVRQDLAEVARAATAGRGPDRVFEAVGAAPTIQAALEVPRKAGTLVVIGVAPTSAEVTLRPYELFTRELTVHFSYVRHAEFQRAVALLPHLRLEPLLTHRYPLERTMEAIAAASGRQGLKIQVQPGL
jgi:2-desacetyl-2-hydroxyethyl bacteriochlorophyllide A dehydrogenase